MTWLDNNLPSRNLIELFSNCKKYLYWGLNVQGVKGSNFPPNVNELNSFPPVRSWCPGPVRLYWAGPVLCSDELLLFIQYKECWWRNLLFSKEKAARRTIKCAWLIMMMMMRPRPGRLRWPSGNNKNSSSTCEMWDVRTPPGYTATGLQPAIWGGISPLWQQSQHVRSHHHPYPGVY